MNRSSNNIFQFLPSTMGLERDLLLIMAGIILAFSLDLSAADVKVRRAIPEDVPPTMEEPEEISEGALAAIAVATFCAGCLFMIILLSSEKIAEVCCQHRTLVKKEGRYDVGADGFDNPIYATAHDFTLMYSPQGGVRVIDMAEEARNNRAEDAVNATNSDSVDIGQIWQTPMKLDITGMNNDNDIYVDMGAIPKKPRKEKKREPTVQNPMYDIAHPFPGIATQLSVELFVDPLNESDAMVDSGLPGISNLNTMTDLNHHDPEPRPTISETGNTSPLAIENKALEAPLAQPGPQQVTSTQRQLYLTGPNSLQSDRMTSSQPISQQTQPTMQQSSLNGSESEPLPVGLDHFQPGLNDYQPQTAAHMLKLGSLFLGNDVQNEQIDSMSPIFFGLRPDNKDTALGLTPTPTLDNGFSSVDLLTAPTPAAPIAEPVVTTPPGEPITDGVTNGHGATVVGEGTVPVTAREESDMDTDIPEMHAPPVPSILQFTCQSSEDDEEVYTVLPLTKNNRKKKQSTSVVIIPPTEDSDEETELNHSPPPIPSRSYTPEPLGKNRTGLWLIESGINKDGSLDGRQDGGQDGYKCASHNNGQDVGHYEVPVQSKGKVIYGDDPDATYAYIEFDSSRTTNIAPPFPLDTPTENILPSFTMPEQNASLPAAASLADISNSVLGSKGEIISLPTKKVSKVNLHDKLFGTGDDGDKYREESVHLGHKMGRKKELLLQPGFVNPLYDFDGDDVDVDLKPDYVEQIGDHERVGYDNG